MSDAEFKKSFNATEAEAINIIQVQNPRFKKIEGNEFKLFYEQFEIQYNQARDTIKPNGQPDVGFGRKWNNLYVSISTSRQFLTNYYNTRQSYQKSVHFLGASFGRLMGLVQFGFKSTNPDMPNYKNDFLEHIIEMRRILKTINKDLRFVYIPKRILEIYHQDSRDIHFFTVQFAQELLRPA